MTPEHWQHIKEVFYAALERPPAERESFIDSVCSGDEETRREVSRLISAHLETGEFLAVPAFDVAAKSLASSNRENLTQGESIRHYTVIRAIGTGGMGEVYLAEDTRLGRNVAIKLLHASFTRQTDRLQRFEREARAASALNHPNVCTVYEVGEMEDGRPYIVMEYIEGMTLRQRMNHGHLLIPEVLDIATQVGSALQAAHQAGILHRDVKPENVMLRRDGYVKVLDFGLAKLTEQQSLDAAAGPTTCVGMNTDTGVAGTAGYMSPEQAQGLSVDQRTDIFSLGVVLYEMVTGRLPFEARSPRDAIVSMTKEPPPLTHYLSKAPGRLQPIVNKALRRNREERYQTITELLGDLKSVSSARTAKSRFTTRRLSLLAAALALMIGGPIWFYVSRPNAKSTLPPMKYVSFTSFPGFEGRPAFSPDGNQIAFDWSGEKNDNPDIYVMLIGSQKPLRLTTDPAADYGPKWSPDGRQIAFMRVSKSEIAIYTVPALGGPERKLLSLGAKADWGSWVPALDWSPDGKYIACSEKRSSQPPFNIFLFSPETGERRALTSPAAPLLGDSFPAFSPDSQTVAFVRTTADVSQDVYLVPITGGEPKRLTFDNVRLKSTAWNADGREIIFSSTREGGDYGLWRISTSGGTPERAGVGGHHVPGASVSRQGNRLAYVQWSGDFNIYRVDVSDSTRPTSPPIKLTSSTRLDFNPQYSPDGKRIVFQSDRSGSNEIWMCNSDGANPVQVTSLNKIAGTPRWSPDGQQIAFDLYPDGRGDIYVISAGGGLPRPIVTGDSEDHLPSWSIDGRWIYFASHRTGERQVWKVPAEGGKPVQVTKQGGGIAFESPDGRYVYYIKDFAPGIWRVPVDGGEEIQVFDSFRSELFGDWAVVSDGVYFINPDAKDGVAIEFFNFATRKVKQVAALGKVAILPFGMAVSPDRRQIVHAQNDNPGGDIMLVENFR